METSVPSKWGSNASHSVVIISFPLKASPPLGYTHSTAGGIWSITNSAVIPEFDSVIISNGSSSIFAIEMKLSW